jgi:hypothetical protein
MAASVVRDNAAAVPTANPETADRDRESADTRSR